MALKTIFKLFTLISLILLINAYRYPHPLKTAVIVSKNYGIKFDKGFLKNHIHKL